MKDTQNNICLFKVLAGQYAEGSNSCLVCPVACKSIINELTHLMAMHSMQTWIVIMCFIICD